MCSAVLSCFDPRQGPLKPEVLSIQWSGRRSNRRLQRNNSLSPNNPLLSLVNSGGVIFSCLNFLNSTSLDSVSMFQCILFHSTSVLSYVALLLPEPKKLIGQSQGVRVRPVSRTQERRLCRCEKENKERFEVGGYYGVSLFRHNKIMFIAKVSSHITMYCEWGYTNAASKRFYFMTNMPNAVWKSSSYSCTDCSLMMMNCLAHKHTFSVHQLILTQYGTLQIALNFSSF